jgi:hypothetical protein
MSNVKTIRLIWDFSLRVIDSFEYTVAFGKITLIRIWKKKCYITMPHVLHA